MKVLIADDDMLIREILKSYMKPWGYDPIIAENGNDALQILNEPNPPMVAIVDWSMPGLSGVEICRRIREEHPDALYYLIILTARSEKEHLVSALQAGANDYIRKPFDLAELKARLETGKRIVEMQSRLENQLKANEQLVNSINSILISVNEDNIVMHWNRSAEDAFGIKESEALNNNFSVLPIKWNWNTLSPSIDQCIITDEVVTLNDFTYIDQKERERFLNININPYIGSTIDKRGFLILANDVTEQKFIESQLMHSQKLESIGQLAAGIAHEINTPVQFVTDNSEFLKESFDTIADILQYCENTLRQCAEKYSCPELLVEVLEKKEENDTDFLLEEIPSAISQNLEGLQKVATIVKAMKEFSFPAQKEMIPTDLANAIQNTITVARNEWKYVSELETEFDEDLPPVYCHPGELNQVILNLIINAVHAIQDKLDDSENQKGTITIRTLRDKDTAIIQVSDTGSGIPIEVQKRIFDPFFTTKDVGKGTGQGLFISHSVIVDKHHGTITFESRKGVGTTFTIRIPIMPGNQQEEPEDERE